MEIFSVRRIGYRSRIKVTGGIALMPVSCNDRRGMSSRQKTVLTTGVSPGVWAVNAQFLIGRIDRRVSKDDAMLRKSEKVLEKFRITVCQA
jgi:hypothetical protein